MTDKDPAFPHLSHTEVSPHSLFLLRSPHFLFFSTNHTHKRNPRTEIVSRSTFLPRRVDIYPAANLRAALPDSAPLLPLPGTSHSLTESEQKTQDILSHFPRAFLHPGAKPFFCILSTSAPCTRSHFLLIHLPHSPVLVTHHKRTLRHPVCISRSRCPFHPKLLQHAEQSFLTLPF